jgi:hypothetical protein
MNQLDLHLRFLSVNSKEFATLRSKHPWQLELARSLAPLRLQRQQLLSRILRRELAKQ